MKLEDILRSTSGKWIEGSGPSSDIVISSRVRLARNVADRPFPQRASMEQKEAIVDLVGQALSGADQQALHDITLFRFDELDTLDRQVLMEKHLVSPAHARETSGAAVALRSDEAVSIMVNEEDHLRLQCLVPGLDLESAWELVDQVDATNWAFLQPARQTLELVSEPQS